MGIEVDGKYDGSDCNFTSAILAIEEISKVDASVGVLVDVQNTLVFLINKRLIRYSKCMLPKNKN